MLEKTTIARPYAQAAFNQASEERDLGKWSSMLKLISTIVSDPLMRSVINNPRHGDEQLFSIIEDIAGDTLSKTGKNFLKILIQAGRLAVVPEIFLLFEKKRADAEGLAEVEVISAFPLLEDQQKTIAKVMATRLGKKIEIKTSIDSSLIGGAVIRTGDSVIDASIRGRLKQLANEFA
jgi:F-type H+-transporting ATPase subunit delta